MAAKKKAAKKKVAKKRVAAKRTSPAAKRTSPAAKRKSPAKARTAALKKKTVALKKKTVAAMKKKVASVKKKVTAIQKKVVAKATAAKAKVAKATAPKPAALRAGGAAPHFALQDQTGRTIKLSDYRGRKLLIYFYPKADTPGCTIQSCSVRDARKDLTTVGVEVLGISPDKPTAQAKFDQKFGLGFPLLSDPDHAVADAYGAWGEKSMYGQSYMGIIRSSFLVGEDGRLLGAWSPVKPDETVPNATAILSSTR